MFPSKKGNLEIHLTSSHYVNSDHRPKGCRKYDPMACDMAPAITTPYLPNKRGGQGGRAQKKKGYDMSWVWYKPRNTMAIHHI